MKFAWLLVFSLFSAVSFAAGPPTPAPLGCDPDSPTHGVCSAMEQLCQGIESLVPVASMLMLVIAAVIYAAGQMMGAETRARANVWATAALTGALIGVLIVAIAPSVLGTISNQTINCGGA